MLGRFGSDDFPDLSKCISADFGHLCGTKKMPSSVNIKTSHEKGPFQNERIVFQSIIFSDASCSFAGDILFVGLVWLISSYVYLLNAGIFQLFWGAGLEILNF